jgi:hypothetical protein
MIRAGIPDVRDLMLELEGFMALLCDSLAMSITRCTALVN